MRDAVFINVWAFRHESGVSGELHVTRRHKDGSEESFRYPLPDPDCSRADNVDDWARELMVQAIEQI